MSARILVVDPDPSSREALRRRLDQGNRRVKAVVTLDEALNTVVDFDPTLIITDEGAPGTHAFELLERLGSADGVDMVVTTAHGAVGSAVGAMRAGAFDYVSKPVDTQEIDNLIERAERRRARRRAKCLLPSPNGDGSPAQLVGEDPKMVDIYKTMGMLAANQATVLLTGETGTGKELIARGIHQASARTSEPFIAVNCVAIAESLLESELFGHTRGAFTGAVASREGFFELARSGTVFLDEIADTGPGFQSKLLRILDDGAFYPVGGQRPRRVTARIIAAARHPLRDLVRQGRFREDLFFRLQVVEIHVPPLRERKGDIPLLAQHLLARIGRELEMEVAGLTHAALREMEQHEWPGNVRELKHALTRAAVLSRGSVIDTEHLRLCPIQAEPPEVTLDAERLDVVEAAHVQRILVRTNGNKRHTARVLGISRPRLDRLIVKHGLRVPGRRVRQ